MTREQQIFRSKQGNAAAAHGPALLALSRIKEGVACAFDSINLRTVSNAKALSAFLMFVVLASVVVIELLHDHECSGDGCVLCFIVGCAYVMLCVCMGILIARSILRVIADMKSLQVVAMFVLDARKSAIAYAGLARTVQTPVTMGVRLLI